MAIAVRAYASAATNSTPLVINKPTGTADGDVLVACIDPLVAKGVTPPAGFTAVGRGAAGLSTFALFGSDKIAASEGTTYSFAVVGSVTAWHGIIVCLSGAHATPFDVVGSGANGSGSTATITGLTTTVANEIVLLFVTCSASATQTTPSGWTFVTSQAGTDGNTTYCYKQMIAAPGVVSSAAVTLSGSVQWAGYMIAYKPATVTAQFWTDFIKSYEADS